MVISERENIIERIKKLKAKADNSASTESEAEMFAAKVTALMEEHAILQSELGESPEHMKQEYIMKSVRVWKRDLMEVCAYTTFCQVVFFGYGNNNKIELVGRPLNIQACISMYEFIVKQIEHIGRRTYPDSNKDAMNVMSGVVEGVGYKIAKSRQTTQDSKLPVIQEFEASKEATHKFYPEIKPKLELPRERTMQHVQGNILAEDVKLFNEVK